MEEMDFLLDRLSGFNGTMEQFCLVPDCDTRQEGHHRGKIEVQGIDCSQGADPEVLKTEYLFLSPEVFLNTPAAKERNCYSNNIHH